MYNYKAKLIRTIDGDTVDLMVDLGFDMWHKIRVRLDGINTPESRTRDLREKKLGLEAKKFTDNFLEGNDILVDTNKQGKFGRFLANLTVDGADLAQALIEANLAREYHGEKRGKWFEEKEK